MRRAVIALIVLFGARAAAAGDELIADRPGVGESASVVGRWRVQLETGLTWARVDQDTRAFDLPQALVRLGLGGSLELRMLAPDWLRSAGPGGAESGWADTAVGLKWHVAAGFRPLHLIDLGYAWLPHPDTQLDLSVGLGLSDAAPDFFLGLGFSRRF
jgi:hypothetical protein